LHCSSLLGGAGLRLAGLGVQELRGDEAFSFLYARQPFAEIVPSLLRDADPHPPLHYLLLAIWMRLAGDGELALRLPSALAGTLLLPALFQVGRRLLGREGALITLLLAALSPALIWLSQDVRSQYMLVLLLATGATWLLLHAVRRPRWYGWLLYALLAALAMYIHYYALFALLAHGLYLLAGRRRLLEPWLLSGLLALLLFSPWLRAASPGWLSQLLDPGGLDFADYLAMVGQELVTGAAVPLRVARWLALLALLVAAAGFRHLRSRRPATALLLAAWLMVALWGIFLVTIRRATFNPFYVAVAAPAWFLLLGAGFVSLRRGRLPLVGPRLALSGLLLLLVVAAFSLAATMATRSPTAVLRATARWQPISPPTAGRAT
jgi:mannosyltransferase